MLDCLYRFSLVLFCIKDTYINLNFIFIKFPVVITPLKNYFKLIDHYNY